MRELGVSNAPLAPSRGLLTRRLPSRAGLTGLLNRGIVGMVGVAPRRVVAAIAGRYVSGEDLASAIEAARQLRARGLAATLDVLGEAVSSDEEADRYVAMYLDALTALVDAGLEPHVSLKPTAFGTLPKLAGRQEASERRCAQQYREKMLPIHWRSRCWDRRYCHGPL